MTYLFSKETLLDLKRMKRDVLIRILLSSILYIALMALCFIFQNRKYQILFTIIIGLLTVLTFAYILFVLVELNTKRRSYLTLVNNINKSNHILNDILVMTKEEKKEHILGLEVTIYKVREIDTKKEFQIYIDEFHNDELTIDKVYQVETYHNFVIAYKENSDVKAD